MGNIVFGLLHGLVVETTTESWTGKYLYSDWATSDLHVDQNKDSALNRWARFPIVGIAAGISRVALGIIHTLGHLLAALLTQDKGHLFHAAKGCCEILRGMIEATPIIGRIFANKYNSLPWPYHELDLWDQGYRSWWMMKIYHPGKPDGLDNWMNGWKGFPSAFYIKV